MTFDKIAHDKTITVLNRLRSVDSATHKDIWYKTVINQCGWYNEALAQMSKQDTNVVIGGTIKVLIPFNTGYKRYKEWKQSGGQINSFTMSNDDYIILGEVQEEITPDNVIKVVQSYSPYVCNVKFFRELDKRMDNTIELFVRGV